MDMAVDVGLGAHAQTLSNLRVRGGKALHLDKGLDKVVNQLLFLSHSDTPLVQHVQQSLVYANLILRQKKVLQSQ